MSCSFAWKHIYSTFTQVTGMYILLVIIDMRFTCDVKIVLFLSHIPIRNFDQDIYLVMFGFFLCQGCSNGWCYPGGLRTFAGFSVFSLVY